MSGLHDVLALLSSLERVGARVEVNAAGDGVRVVADVRPPADLMQRAKELKPELLAHLLAAKSETVSLLPVEDLLAEASKPGRCGSCARSKPAPEEWGAGMVVCTCDPVAWWPMLPPFAMTETARCGAFQLPGEDIGQGWRAKSGGKRWGAFPSSPVEGVPDSLGGVK